MTEIVKQETIEKINEDVIATNINSGECYKDAPVVEIPKADFDYYMQIFEKYETNKVKRAECQKRYFQNNKKAYYERQKKWRDGHKVDLNAKRRERYANKKIMDVAGNDVTSLGGAVQEPSSVEEANEQVVLVSSVQEPSSVEV